MATSPELIIRIGANSKAFDKELRGLEGKAERTTRAMDKVARAGAVAVTALAAGLAASINQFISYEDALVGVKKTTDLTGRQLEQFKISIKGLSEELGQSQESLLNISETAGQLGVRGAKDLSKFTKTIAQLNVASSSLQGADAANALARILSITNEGFDNVDKFASVIARLGDNFATSEAQIAEMTLNIVQAGGAFKTTSAEAAGLAAAFSQLGINPEIARTTLLKFGVEMEKVLRKGGKELQLLQQMTNLTEEQLRKTFKDNAPEFLQIFLKGLNETTKGGVSAAQVLKRFNLAGLRSLPTLSTLAKSNEQVATALKMQADEYKKGTKLQEEFSKKAKTTTYAINKAKVAAQNLGIAIGSEFSNQVKTGFNVLAENINDATPKIINFTRDISAGMFIVAETIADFFTTIFNRMLGNIKNIGATISTEILGLLGLINDAGKFVGKDLGLDNFLNNFTNSIREAKKQANDLLAESTSDKFKDRLNKRLDDLKLYNEQEKQIRKEQQDQESTDLVEHEENKTKIKVDANTTRNEIDEQNWEDKQDKDEERFQEELELIQERLQGIDEIEAQFKGLREMRELQELKKKAKTGKQKQEIDKQTAIAGEKYTKIQTKAAIDGLSELLGTTSKVGKAVFLLNKAFAIADTITTTQDAAMRAYASQIIPGDPSSIARAEAAKRVTLIMGAINVATIAATAIQGVSGAKEGGIVQGGVFGKDTQPFMLAKDEIILPSKVNPLSPNFDDTFGSSAIGGQNVSVEIGFNEDASRILTVKQREDSALGIQR